MHGGNGGDQTLSNIPTNKDSGDDGLGTDIGIGGIGGCDAYYIILHAIDTLGCWNAGEDGTDGLNGTDALGGI